jgi:hypothetical protein
MLEEKFLFDLQLFADTGDSADDVQDNQNQDNDADANTDNDIDIEKLFKNEQFKRLFQSELDKRIAQALKTNDKKWKQKLEEEKQKATMTAEELLTQKEKELRERELKLQKIEYFKDNNIPLDFVDYIHGEDIDEIAEKTKVFMKIFNTEVQKTVEARLKDGYIPPKNKDSNKLTLEDIKKMTPDEINKNWDVIKTLLKQSR